jgi:hypothetical protein
VEAVIGHSGAVENSTHWKRDKERHEILASGQIVTVRQSWESITKRAVCQEVRVANSSEEVPVMGME